jgi:ABC-type nitrate/sulfonate/bicarbonate transport system substrate-binding protein
VRNKIITNISLLFFGLISLVCLRGLDAQELKPIRISLSLGSAQLPLWVAREAGLFAKQGLNAELLGLQSAARQVQLILAGDTLAASLSGTTPIRARIEGADIMIMMGLLNSFTLAVITVPEIKNAADLKGKFIGVGSLGLRVGRQIPCDGRLYRKRRRAGETARARGSAGSTASLHR